MDFKKQAGFTLIEIMLVVIILGILVGIIAPRLTGRTEQAKFAAGQADIDGNLSLALDLYELDNGNYPSTAQGLEALVSKPSSPPVPSNWKGPYIKKGIRNDPWGNPYAYLSPGIHNSEDYDLSSNGPDGVPGGEDDITNWSKVEGE